MRIASVVNNTLNWVSISSAGALDMTHCDFSVHELTSEVNSRMQRVAKFMAMPRTRTTVADLCMFGLAACDEGGPGFVNASVRTVTNARQVGMRMQSKCTGKQRHAQVRKWNKEEHGYIEVPEQWRIHTFILERCRTTKFSELFN